jgi:hypothetical protein
MPEPRRRRQRVIDTLDRLEREDDIWLATASLDGVPHAVPFSLWWSGEEIGIATPTASVTVRNIAATGRVRAMLGDTGDVVIVDGEPRIDPYADVDADVAAAFVRRVGWDPGSEPGEWSLVRITPTRVLAWNSIEETDGRTIMSNGAWAT